MGKRSLYEAMDVVADAVWQGQFRVAASRDDDGAMRLRTIEPNGESMIVRALAAAWGVELDGPRPAPSIDPTFGEQLSLLSPSARGATALTGPCAGERSEHVS